MPFAHFVKVREVSSEDNVHLAENLINNRTSKKWKTKDVGEKFAHVILEMSESYQIVGIDIGNEHSAFVEVLVGKSTCAPEDFKEILLTCSFMTPLESKSSNNTNRVRCFSKEALVPIVVDSKWSLVKIVCTQPFNKHVQYGLSFIKLHVQENLKPKETGTQISTHFLSLVNSTNENKAKHVNNVSGLKFREDSPDSETDGSESLFSRWKKFKDGGTKSVSTKNKGEETVFRQRLADSSIRDRNRDDLGFGEDNLDKSSKLERLSKRIKDDKEERRLETEKIPKNNMNSFDKIRMEKSSESKTNSVASNLNNIKRSKKHVSSLDENKVKKVRTTAKFAPFHQLLSDVVLVISGIQNPERSDLRNKGLAMGAKYKGDWDSTCTHLICAFKNTPKYNQVKGKGKIVSPSWINQCFSLKKYIPWRRYALDSNELGKPESDEEIIVEPIQSPSHKIDNNNDIFAPAPTKKRITTSESNTKNDTIGIYDIDDRKEIDSTLSGEISSDCDTDDEIKKVQESLKNKSGVYDASTDEDDYLKEKYSQL